MEFNGLLRRQVNTVGHIAITIGIVTTAALLQIEEMAGDRRVIDLARLLILQLLQTATGTAITERLPLLWAQLIQWIPFPELFTHGRLVV